MEETRFTESGENASETKDERSAENEQLEYIMKSGSVVSRRDGESVHCLTIIGQIEGHYTVTDGSKATKYEHIIPLLVSVEESDDIDGMLMVLNTMGGDVEAGLAIAEMVASMSKPTVSLVLGGGHSIGVPLSVSARRSVHRPVRDDDDTPGQNERNRDRRAATYYYFERMQDRIIKFVTSIRGSPRKNSGNTFLRPTRSQPDTGSLIDGIEAVSCGLIDEAGGLSDALSFLRDEIRRFKKR